MSEEQTEATNNAKCENCMEWEWFDDYGYGCFCMKTMSPIDANECAFYAPKKGVRE